MKKLSAFLILSNLFFLNLYPMQQLNLAIKNENLEEIQNLISEQPDLLFEYDEDNNWTPLHLAACHCNKPVIKLLLTLGAHELINEPDRLGRTPLHLAVEAWPVSEEFIDEKTIKLLLKHGAKESVNMLDSFKRTPLFYAARHKSPAIARLLLNHEGEKTINQAELQHRMTPLHHAVQWSRVDTIHLLLQKGALEVADTYDSCMRKPSDMCAGGENYAAIAAEFNYFKGRYENAPKERLAFFMASHDRTGADSPAYVLPIFIFQCISSFIPRVPQD